MAEAKVRGDGSKKSRAAAPTTSVVLALAVAVPLAAVMLAAIGAVTERSARADAAPAPRRWLSPQPTGENLRALWGSDGAVFAVGEGGTILRSADHGATWAAAASGTTRHLSALWGSPEGDLWAAGDQQTILRSTDGGLTWRQTPAPSAGNLTAVWGSDPHDVYFAAADGQLLHTDDHGRTFTTLRPLGQTDEQLTAVWGSAADDVYVTGDRGSVLATQDHGQHWTTLRQQTPRPASPPLPPAATLALPTAGATKTPAPGAPATAAKLPDKLAGLATSLAAASGGSSALTITGTRRADSLAVFTSWAHTRKGSTGGMDAEHTADGGKTWKEIQVAPTPARWPGFRAFYPADERTIYGVATFELGDRPIDERQRTGLIVSSDGGATFERRSILPRGGAVNALWRDPTGPLIAVGPAGSILRSTDDGKSWEERTTHPFGGTTLRGIWTDGAGQVWIVGEECTVLHSSDGGSRFETLRPCPAGGGTELRSVWGSSADDVYVSGTFITHTTDRGKSWSVVTPPAAVTAPWRVWGSGPRDIYAAGYGVWISTDGSRSWRLVDGSRSRNPSDRFSDVFGIGESRFAFTELAGLERGSRTGASWQPVAPPVPGWKCCAFWADGAKALYAMGPDHGLFRSTDAGKTFLPVTTPLGKLTTFITLLRRGEQLYLLGDDPMQSASVQQRTLLTSLDDGQTWTPYATLPAGTTALAPVENDLMVVGTGGLLMRLR